MNIFSDIQQSIRKTDQQKLIDILQKASNCGKQQSTTDNSLKINNWFESEFKRNNDLLSPIIKESAFKLEDIEKN